MRNAGLEEAQAGIKIARRNISNLRYADDTTLMAESEEELNSLLMKVKEESEKTSLKLKTKKKKTKIMASGSTTSWQIDGETMKQWQILFSWVQKSLQMMNAAMKLKDACSLEEKWPNYTALKNRDITLPTKVHLIKAMVFPVVMYGCESWTIKKAEHRRTDAFELWCWRRIFRVPRTAKITTQSILKEISPEYSLERLMRSWSSNTLATWCKELTHLTRSWCWGRLKVGGEGGNRGWDGWMALLTRWT